MASTRLHNSKKDYSIQQKQKRNMEQYHVYKYSKIPTQTHLAGFGINAGKMNAGYYHNTLSNNACAIESNLFGIGSTNLVEKQKTFHPSLNTVSEKNFFETPNVFLPNPLAVERNQRPKGPFC